VNGELIGDPIEQQAIELIRRHHKSGKSLQQIANWLNHQEYTTKRGHQWRRISVKRVLDRLYGRTPTVSSMTQKFDLPQDDRHLKTLLDRRPVLSPLSNPPHYNRIGEL
jgi:hypothetical protein